MWSFPNSNPNKYLKFRLKTREVVISQAHYPKQQRGLYQDLVLFLKVKLEGKILYITEMSNLNPELPSLNYERAVKKKESSWWNRWLYDWKIYQVSNTTKLL